MLRASKITAVRLRASAFVKTSADKSADRKVGLNRNLGTSEVRGSAIPGGKGQCNKTRRKDTCP